MLNITLIGFGYVGSSIALLLLNSEHPIRLNIMDPDPSKEGALIDLAHGSQLFKGKELYINDIEQFGEADFVYYSAGASNAHGVSRLAIAEANIALVKEIFGSHSFRKTPYVIVITNPVDIVSHAIHKYSGLPSNKVIGTGTYLESIRLAYYLSELTGKEVSTIDAIVLGEHGDSQVPIYSMTKVKGSPILDLDEISSGTLDKASQLTRTAAFQIRETQIGTTYGVSMCSLSILDYIMSDATHTLPLSMLTNDYYRQLLGLQNDIYISVLVKIKNGNIESIPIELSDKELEMYQASAQLLAKITTENFNEK